MRTYADVCYRVKMEVDVELETCQRRMNEELGEESRERG
jgi:hypothetical protein